MNLDQTVTWGNYADESFAETDLDKLLDRTELFRIYRQVDGQIIQPRLMAKNKDVRIDRILIPTRKLVDLGWERGAIGVEAKKSGEKIGPPIAQIMDYSRTVWTLPEEGSFVRIMCLYTFLWPCLELFGNLASVAAQNRIGTVEHNHAGKEWENIIFKLANQNLIKYQFTDRTTEIGAKYVGHKTGSR